MVFECEKKGGFGRHIKGIERAMEKFSKTESTYDMMLELQDYLEDISLARKLQASNVFLLTDEKFTFIIDKFRQKYKFNRIMCKRIMERNMVAAAKKIVAEHPGALTAETVLSKAQVFSLWPVTANETQPFDVMNNKLVSLGGVSSTLPLFLGHVGRSLLVPMILGNEPHAENLMTFIDTFRTYAASVGDIHLDGDEVSVREDLFEVFDALKGVYGDLTTQCKNVDHVLTMGAVGTNGASDLMTMISRAVRGSDYKAKLELICDNASVMKSVVPSLDIHVARLNETGLDALQPSIVAAAKFLIDFCQLVPDASWFDALRTQLTTVSESYVAQTLQIIRQKAQLEDAESVSSVKQAIQLVQGVVGEMSLAFPMDNFHHEWSTLLADAIRANDAKSFEKRFFASLSEFSATFEDNEAPTPACNDKAQHFRTILHQASKAVHFQTSSCSNRLKTLVTDHICQMGSRLTSKWEVTSDVIDELAKFINHKDKATANVMYEMSCFDASVETLRKSVELGKAPTYTEWGPSLTDAKSKMLALEVKLAPQAGSKKSDDVPLAFTNIEALTISFAKHSDNFKDCGAKCIQSLNDEVTPTIARVRAGPIQVAIGWLSDRAPSEWRDFDELTRQFDSSLKSVKLKDIAATLKLLRSLHSSVLVSKELLSCDVACEIPLETLVKDVGLAKMTSCLMRHLTTKAGPEASLRPFVRAEILEATPMFAASVESFVWAVLLPRALAEKTYAIISPKRKHTTSGTDEMLG